MNQRRTNIFQSDDIIVRAVRPSDTLAIQISIRDWPTDKWVHAQIPWQSLLELLDALYAPEGESR